MGYQQLDSDKIVETVSLLARRIKERFPQAGLNHVCQKLLEVARRAKQTATEIDRPIRWARVLSAAIILSLVGVLGMIAWTTLDAQRQAAAEQGVQPGEARLTAVEWIQAIDAGMNELIAIGFTVFFLVSLERRLKRRRALQAIHELRVISHIIDMHQLTKDPEHVIIKGPDTTSSPKRTLNQFELNRYLDYCSEMLALVGKIAALYVQNFPDEQAVSAVNQVEDLTAGLSRKIWQKIMIVHTARTEAAA